MRIDHSYGAVGQVCRLCTGLTDKLQQINGKSLRISIILLINLIACSICILCASCSRCMLVVEAVGLYTNGTISTNPYSISCESASVRIQIVCGLSMPDASILMFSSTRTHPHMHPFDTNECILSIIKCNLKPNGRVLICMLSLMVRIISVSDEICP